MDNKFFPERLDRNKVYECGIFSLYTDKVKLPSGYIIEKYHQIHHHHEGVSIVVFNNKDEILMIREMRYTVGHLEWEIPAGERTEIGNTIAIAERAIKDLKIAETVTLVQEERSKHFHIWIFPNQEWMQEQFGYGLQYLRDINAFAKDNASDADIENVIRTAEEIKKYIESEDKYD